MGIPFRRDDALAPGEAEDTAPGVRRILCGNPSAFTFRGTNTYIIGTGRVAVMDPGPENAAHLAAILAATQGETVTHVIVTHTHRDHSPGAAALVAKAPCCTSKTEITTQTSGTIRMIASQLNSTSAEPDSSRRLTAPPPARRPRDRSPGPASRHHRCRGR